MLWHMTLPASAAEIDGLDIHFIHVRSIMKMRCLQAISPWRSISDPFGHLGERR